MSEYWSSTKSPVHLFKREYETADVAKHLNENAFVDPAQLADELRLPHLNPQAVKAYQRRLGVRRITGNGEKPLD